MSKEKSWLRKKELRKEMFVRKEVGQKKKKQLFPNKEIYFSEREEFVYKENKNKY